MKKNDEKLIRSPSTPGKRVQSKTMRSSSGVETEWPPTPQLPKRSLCDMRKTMRRGSEADQLTNNVKKFEESMTRSMKNNLEKLTRSPSTPGKKVQSKTMRSRSGVEVKAVQLTNSEEKFEDSMTRSRKNNLEKLMGSPSTRGKKGQSKTMRPSSRVEVKADQLTESPPAPQLQKRRHDPGKTMRRGSEAVKAEQPRNNVKKFEDSMTRSMRNNLEKLIGSTSTPGKKVQCKTTGSGMEAKSWQLKRKRNEHETMRRDRVQVKPYEEPRPLSSLPPKKRGCSSRDLKELEIEASRRSPHAPLKPIRTVELAAEVLMNIQSPKKLSGSGTSANSDNVRDGKDKTLQTARSKSKEKSSNASVAKERNLPPEQKARVKSRRRRYIVDSDSSSYGC